MKNAIILVQIFTFLTVTNQKNKNYTNFSFKLNDDNITTTILVYNKYSINTDEVINEKYFYPTDTKEPRKSNIDPPLDSIITRRNYAVDEAHMDVPQIIQKHDYPSEVYTVPTQDGYVLTLHRIPRGKTASCRRANRPRPVAFLMHGIFASSADFILNGPGRSLGYLLADAGYDVWMGNARGNRYSRNHRTMIPANMAFWDFSFHEIGYYDLPAMIDFILGMSGMPNLFYVGHSQGSTIFYILGATRPEYNSKIIASFSMSPVAYMSHMTSPFLRFFATFSNPIGLFFDIVGIGEFLPSSQFMAQLGHLICKGIDFTQFICTTPMFVLTGFNPDNLNKTQFPLYMGHMPAGSSTRQVIHYGQLYQSGKFRQYDLGMAENLVTYNSMYPPNYNLNKVTAPVHLFYTPVDWLAHPTDVDQLSKEMPNTRRHQVKDPNFAHFDFMYGINAKEMAYDPLMKEMNNYIN